MAASTNPDLIIRNGRVIDPANGIDRIADVEICDGKIVNVGDLPHDLKPKEVYDARSCVVIPGMIDLHTHVYEYATPLGINADQTCLARGVTTVVDAGSAGACTLPGLHKYICEQSKTRVLAFVHIASHGLSSAAEDLKGGECDSLNQVVTDLCVNCIKANRDIVVGVKARLTASVADDGKNEEEVFRRAIAASSSADVPLMVHYVQSTIPINVKEDFKGLSCPGSLKKGDILTHALHGHTCSIIDPIKNTVYPCVYKAREKGVLIDVGHGVASFSWTVAEACAKENFWPDVISSDLHIDSLPGPAYDLPMIMTKLLHVGMPLYDVIKAVTMTPASSIGWQDRIGSLSPGFVADVTILRIADANIEVEDTQGQIRNVRRRIIPVAVLREGILHEIQKPDPTPGQNTKRLIQNWDINIIKDIVKPTGKD